jgi:hypothetical protein
VTVTVAVAAVVAGAVVTAETALWVTVAVAWLVAAAVVTAEAASPRFAGTNAKPTAIG